MKLKFIYLVYNYFKNNKYIFCINFNRYFTWHNKNSVRECQKIFKLSTKNTLFQFTNRPYLSKTQLLFNFFFRQLIYKNIKWTRMLNLIFLLAWRKISTSKWKNYKYNTEIEKRVSQLLYKTVLNIKLEYK